MMASDRATAFIEVNDGDDLAHVATDGKSVDQVANEVVSVVLWPPRAP
jgi:hypothetical protein